MVLDTSLLKTQQYKVRIKGKVEQSKERSCTLGIVAIEKEAPWWPSTTVSNFTFFTYFIISFLFYFRILLYQIVENVI